MTHLNSFEVGHYRGIDGVSLPHLSRANLITGANGAASKTLSDSGRRKTTQASSRIGARQLRRL